MKRVLFFICITLISIKCYCTFCGDIPKPKNVISENTLPPEDDDSQFDFALYSRHIRALQRIENYYQEKLFVYSFGD